MGNINFIKAIKSIVQSIKINIYSHVLTMNKALFISRKDILFLYFIGVYLLYTAMSVSAIQQKESAINIHKSPLFLISFPFRSPQSTKESALCYTEDSHWLLFIPSSIYVDPNLPIHPTVSFPPWYLHPCLFLLCK